VQNFPVPNRFGSHVEVHQYVGLVTQAMSDLMILILVGQVPSASLLEELSTAVTLIRANVSLALTDSDFIWDGSDSPEEQRECMYAVLDRMAEANVILDGMAADIRATEIDAAWDEDDFESDFEDFYSDLFGTEEDEWNAETSEDDDDYL